MTQQTRTIVANVLIGVSLLLIIAFVATHFTMAPPRPTWRRELVWVALIASIASRWLRGGRRGVISGAD